MFFNLFFLIFTLNFFCDSTLNINSDDELVLDISNLEGSFSEGFSRIEVGFLDESSRSFFTDDNYVGEICSAISIGGEIVFKKVKSNKKNEIFKNLRDISIYFYIVFFENNESILWKLYSSDNEKFLEGKSYKKSVKKETLLRVVCSDIWNVLFSSETAPFSSYLIYATTGNVKKNVSSEIKIINPFFKCANEIKKLKISRSIVDLNIIDILGSENIVFSEVTSKNVRIIKINNSSNLTVLIDIPGTSTSLCYQDDTAFYIRSQSLYHCYFNFKKRAIYHEPCCDKSKNEVFASVVKGPNGTILCAKDYKIFQINYLLNEDGSIKNIIENQVSPENVFATAVAYNEEIDFIITTEKINNHFQLVLYDKNKNRRILTTSKYSKLEPSISPCGTYVAYTIRDEKSGLKKIEIINLYTKKVILVTKKQDNYVGVSWIRRK
jgi:hypothetical protein